MSFLEDDEDIIFQTKKTKEISEMIEYITNKFYEKFEKAKTEENLLDYIDLEKYTLKLLYDKKEEDKEKYKDLDKNKEEKKLKKSNDLNNLNDSNNIIEKIVEKYKDLESLRESIKIEYDIEKLEEIYNDIFEIIQKEFLNYTELLNNKYVLSNIAKSMKEDVEEIAVDEYQDINMLQEYIIRAVSNKNIFRVGDPKQSIYGFRNSRPELFVEKENNIDNENKVIYLDKNFRSLENVLETTNNVFSRVMTKDTGIIEYNENHYLKKGRYITSEFITDDLEELKRLEIYNLKKEEIADKINFFKPELLIINTEEIEEEKDEEQENYNENKESEIIGDLVTFEKRNTLITNILKTLSEYNMKGLVLEVKNVQDTRAFIRFVTELKPRLKETGKKLVMPNDNILSDTIRKMVDYTY